MKARAYFNHLSIPANSEEDSATLLIDLLTAFSSLVDNSLTAKEWFAEKNIYELELAPGYFPSHFVNEYVKLNRDIVLFFQLITSRAPFLTYESADLQEKLGLQDVKVSILPEIDACILAAAAANCGFSVSLDTNPFWSDPRVVVHIQNHDENLEPIGLVADVNVLNLSGEYVLSQVEGELSERYLELRPDNWEISLPEIKRDSHFVTWFEGLDPICQKKIMEKSSYVRNLGFQTGEPHIKSLNGYNFSAKELRITVHGNSELRIIFHPLGNGKVHYLLGGVKTGGSIWYDQIKESVKNRYQQI